MTTTPTCSHSHHVDNLIIRLLSMTHDNNRHQLYLTFFLLIGHPMSEFDPDEDIWTAKISATNVLNLMSQGQSEDDTPHYIDAKHFPNIHCSAMVTWTLDITSIPIQTQKMACMFSGIFYVHNIHDKYMDCVFLDECWESHQLSILHYDNRRSRDGPFPEASPYIMSGHVYVLHGTMTIIDKDYLHPSVPFHFHLPFLHNTYIWIDASHELLSIVTI